MLLSGGKLKTFGRMAPLVLLLATTLGPWFIDSHPATEATCAAPYIWQGNGFCACRVTFLAAIEQAIEPGHSGLWLLSLPPVLPLFSTLLLRLSGERRWLWIGHLAAWGLAAVYALFLFVGYWYRHPALILWGAGVGGGVAVVSLAGEMLLRKSPARPASPGRVL